MAGLVRDHVVGARIDAGLQHRVAGRFGGWIDDLAHPREHEGHRARFTQVAAVLGEQRADVGGGAVAVVGQRLNDDSDTTRAITLVAHVVIVLGIAADRLLDGTLDIVLGHALGPRILDGETQTGVGVGVRQAGLGGNRYFARQLREGLGAHRVLLALAVHDVLEL